MSTVRQAETWQATEFATVLQRLRIDGTIDAAGRQISADTLDRLLRATPSGADGPAGFRTADFSGATFAGDVRLDGVRFTGTADFSDATFEGGLSLAGSRFDGTARFDRARFKGEVWFGPSARDPRLVSESAACFSDLCLAGAWFERSGDLGSVHASGRVVLDRARFQSHTTAAFSASRLEMGGVRFSGGVSMDLGRGDLVLDQAQFGSPSVIAGLPPGGPPGSTPPRILSLRDADVANLLLCDIGLTCCRFAGAHGLDRIRMQGQIGLAEPPEGWRQRRGWPLWHWSRRGTIAEEHDWRACHDPGAVGWLPKSCRAPQWQSPRSSRVTIGAEEVAAVYRALRKGREDEGDAAGGADFYFGEMEMRREALGQEGGIDAWVYRAILTAYWLVSGYGLRASRSLLALLLTVVIFAAAFYAGGITHVDETRSPTPAGALLYSAQSAAGLFAMPDPASVQLSYGGELLQLGLRILGPLFIGLAILSLRGRIRR